LQTKDISKKSQPIKFEGHRFAEKREIVFFVLHTNASEFSRERRPHFTDKYMKTKNLICGFLCESAILKFERLPLLASILSL